VMRFDAMEPENVSYFGNPDDTTGRFSFSSGGVLGNDGHIYALNGYGQAANINTSARTIPLIGESPCHSFSGHPIIGLDKCFFCFIGNNTGNRILKFDPATQQPPSYVGPDSTILKVVIIGLAELLRVMVSSTAPQERRHESLPSIH
jgi:hypothetical protein